METESTLPAGPLMKRHNGKPGVFVEVDKRLLIPALYGLDRPDIATHFHNERYRPSGFSVFLLH
jgi:hypothetical protein